MKINIFIWEIGENLQFNHGRYSKLGLYWYKSHEHIDVKTNNVILYKYDDEKFVIADLIQKKVHY